MAMMACKDCKTAYSSTAKACPQCEARRSSKIIKYGGGFLLIIFFAWLFLGGTAREEMAYGGVADSYVQQYQIARSNGDKATMCGLAQMAAAAYLSAKYEEQYKTWQKNAERDCGI